MKYYLLVFVEYDHYRLQKNIHLFSSIEKALAYVDTRFYKYPVFIYDGDNDDAQLREKLSHYQIETFTLNK